MAQDSFQVIHEEAQEYWYTRSPNVLWTLDLTPHEYTYYMYMRTVAGEKGCCFQTRATIAKATGISERKQREINEKLRRPIEGLNGKSLLRVYQTTKEDGSAGPTQVIIVNIWDENREGFKKRKVRHDVPGGPAHSAGGPAPDAGKEEPYKKKPYKKKKLSVADAAAPLEKLSSEKTNEPEADAPQAEAPPMIETSESSATTAEDSKNVSPSEKLPTQCKIVDHKGHEIVVRQEDLYRRMVDKGVSWPATAITYAWEALTSYEGAIGDWWAFMEGTVRNYENKLKSKRASGQATGSRHKRRTGSTSCKGTMKSKSEKCKPPRSEEGSQARHLPTSLTLVEMLKASRGF